MTPKEYLSQANQLDNLIQSKLDTISDMRAMATNVSIATDEIKTSKTNAKVDFTSTVDKIIDYSMEVDKEIDKLVDLKSKLMREIDLLDDNLYKTILIKRYINGETLCKIAEDLNYSTRHMNRLHGRALQEFGNHVLVCHR